MKTQKDIRLLSLEQLIETFESLGEKAFRAKQVYEWLWKHGCLNFDEMTNLSISLREKLKASFTFSCIQKEITQRSTDGTVKIAYVLHDNELVEGVMIPSEGRMTACVSSQVGCSLSCKFCATGFLDRKRNLNANEIYDQVVSLNKEALKNFDKPLSNIVYMGMGEPLLNYRNVLQSIEYITSEKGLGMSSKRITVSTAGIEKMIRRLAVDKVKFNLALSLHAADELKRNQIMPINEQNSLESLIKALQYFKTETKSKVTLEYILLNNFNDSIEDAQNLLKIARIIPAMVNVIEYNPVENVPYERSSRARSQTFMNYLERAGCNAHIRRSRGKDIDAACGQLAGKSQ